MAMSLSSGMRPGMPPAAAALLAAAAAAVLLLLHHAWRAVALWRQRAAFQRAHGVRPAPWFRQRRLLRGFDTMRENRRAQRQHRAMELTLERFRRPGSSRTMQLYLLGRHIHTTIEPDNIKTIQALDHKKWHLNSRRKTGFEPLLGKGIFTTDGPEWQHSREMLRPNFVRSQIDDLEALETHVARLVARVPRDGATVDLAQLFFCLTMDSATEFLFGESTASLLQDRAGADFAAAFVRAQDDAGTRAQLGWWYYLTHRDARRRAARDIAFVHAFADAYVDRGLARAGPRPGSGPASAPAPPAKEPPRAPSGRYVFLDELVRQTDDRVRIRSELINILVAGRDTTASLLTNVWFVLGKRPDLWRKLQADVASLDGCRPSFKRLKDLRFLRALLNESLRLHPVVPANAREAVEDTTLPVGGGPDGTAPIFVRKGEIVAWSAYSMHRRKDLYGPDADDFRPERWLDDALTGTKGLRPGWEYLPFNGGARICLGQQFALTEASYVTVRLCQEFDAIEGRDAHEWQENIALTMVNLHGAKVGLFPRKSSSS